MNPNRPITNPMLCGTIELMKAEDTPEHRKMFLDELIRARFLSPVIVTPTPVPDETGRMKITAEHKVQFPMISTKEGHKFFLAFTDLEELKKAHPDKDQQTFILSFDDYAGMLLRKDKDGNLPPALGFVINPMSSNVMVSREMVAKVIASRMAQSGIPVPPLQKKAPEAAEAVEAEE